MIPKIIHYCWFTNDSQKPYPELVEKCIDSWKQILPDYEIKLWNEKTFDIDAISYTKEAFSKGYYSFVSDYIRLYAIYHEGGIYLDTDVEVIKPLDSFLNNKGFTCFENANTVATSILACEKHNPIIKEFLEGYSNKNFLLPDGSPDLTPNTVSLTNICQNHGLKLTGQVQNLDCFTVYSCDYFSPYNRASETLLTSDNTHCIHYFNGAWIPTKKKQIISRRRQIIKKYGKLGGYIYYAIAVFKEYGFRQFWKETSFFMNRWHG